MPLPFLKAAPADGAIGLARHVKSESGVKHFHEPIGALIVPHPHMPKYAQNSTPISHEGKQVGFLAKLPGPMKKSTGKTHAVFDIHGNKVSHVNSHAEAQEHLKITGKVPKDVPKPPEAPAPVRFEKLSSSDLDAMSKDALANHLGQSMSKLGHNHPYTKRVFDKVKAGSEPEPAPKVSRQVYVQDLAKKYLTQYKLAELEQNVKDAPDGSPEVDAFKVALALKRKEIALQYKDVGLATLKSILENEDLPQTVRDVVGEAIKMKTVGPTGHTGMNVPGTPFKSTAMPFSPKAIPTKPLPKYAYGGYKHNGHTIAKLPAPMVKSSGHSYAIFDPNGNKIGYAHTYTDAKQLAEGKGGLSPGQQVKAAKVGMGKSIKGTGSGELLSRTSNTVVRAQQKELMSPNQRDAWGKYTDGVYHTMNAYMRGEGVHSGGYGYDETNVRSMIQHMTAAFDAVGFKTTKEEVVHRGTGSFAYYGNVGDIIGVKGFTSTSASYSSTFGGNKLKIQVPAGQKYLLGTSGEKEVIFPPGIKLRVLAVDGQGKVTDVEVV